MRRSGIWFLVTLVTISIAAVGAFASSVHLKPPNRNPTFTDNGLTLTVSGQLAGLGNGDVLITLTARGNPTATCANPSGGGQEPPGQNPAEVVLTGTESIPESEVDNGNVSFTVITAPPVSPVVGAPDCPNPQWTETITNVAFTSATIVVEQPEDTVVLTVSCTFSPPTSNGTVPSRNISCTSI